MGAENDVVREKQIEFISDIVLNTPCDFEWLIKFSYPFFGSQCVEMQKSWKAIEKMTSS